MKILILFLVLISQASFAQLGKTKAEVFSNEGSNFTEKDNQDDFTVYIYSGEIPLLNGEQCYELTSYFMDNDYDICFKVTYTSCAAAANSYVKFLNQVAVKIEQNKWKDYSNDSIYTLLVKDQFAYVEHFYDYE